VSRLGVFGEDDALTNGAGERRRIMVGKGLGYLTGDDRPRAAAVQNEAGDELRPVDARLAQQG